MKKLLALLIGSCVCVIGVAQDYLHVMTFNIRYDNPGDSLNAWPHRKDLVASQILFHEPAIVGVQEALFHQITDLQHRLPGYQYIGGGRDDGKEKGEFSAIFFDSSRLRLNGSATFWLSEKPEVPGTKGWDAALPRVVTWGRFTTKDAGKEFYAFNTHFDHIGKVARRESAALLIKKVAEIAKGKPVVVTGDFNAQPHDEPIVRITSTNNINHLTDSKEVSVTPHYGPTGTFTGFATKEKLDEPIDYIFIRNGVKVLQHATLSQTWKGRFSSDHFPIFARVVIP